MKILTFAGSLRKDSLNKKLCHVVESIVQNNKLGDISFCDLQPLQIPVYDGDIESTTGVPEGIKKLGQMITDAQAVIICTPEYNGSMPGSLKNTVDWLSRQKPVSLSGKHILILAASPGGLGGVRSLWHSRQPFEVLNAHVYPEMAGIAKAHENISADNKIVDPKLGQNLERVVKEFIAYVDKVYRGTERQ